MPLTDCHEQTHDHVDYVLVVNRNWRPATRGLSFGAKGLLVTLVEAAAFSGRQEIAVAIGDIAPHLDNARGREAFLAWFAELRLRRLVRERGPGVFAIAPHLWCLEARPVSAGARTSCLPAWACPLVILSAARTGSSTIARCNWSFVARTFMLPPSSLAVRAASRSLGHRFGVRDHRLAAAFRSASARPTWSSMVPSPTAKRIVGALHPALLPRTFRSRPAPVLRWRAGVRKPMSPARHRRSRSAPSRGRRSMLPRSRRTTSSCRLCIRFAAANALAHAPSRMPLRRRVKRRWLRWHATPWRCRAELTASACRSCSMMIADRRPHGMDSVTHIAAGLFGQSGQ